MIMQSAPGDYWATSRRAGLLLALFAASAGAQVTYKDLLKPDPANWLTYSGSYNSQRHSALTQINAGNAHKLTAKWIFHVPVTGRLESVPVVVDGIMYISQPNEVYALDGRTGRVIWKYRHEPALGRGPNRGVAVFGNRVYFTTPDAFLVALDARSGNFLWQSEIAKFEDGYWGPAAPLVINGKVIAGVAPGDYGMNGLLDAFDSSTGERLWRWNSIPKPGEPGSETWAGDSWKTAGGTTWLTGSYDPELNLIYWGIGNPAPDFNGDLRKGDNLYTECMVALDAATGKMKWYFQFTPHDLMDWDAVEVPVLVDAMLTRRSLKDLAVPTDDQLKAGWLRRGTDYRGVQVLSSLRSVPDSSWAVVSKIDLEEVEAPIRKRWWEMMSLVLLIGIANVSGIALIWRSRQFHEHEERDQWARTIANDTPAYLWMSTATEENSFINKPLAKFLGKPQHRLSGQWASDLHPEDAAAARERFHVCQEKRCAYSDEFRLRRHDGEYRWVLNQGSPRFVNGKFAGYSGSVLDITEHKRAEELLLKANATLQKQLKDRTRAEREIQALNARLINAQEEERARIARELHDDLSQGIATLSLGVSNLKRAIPPDSASALAQSGRLQERIIQLSESVRRLSHQLHPAALEHSGLAAALQAYCSEFEALTGVRVCLQTSGSFERVSKDAAVCLYRITQEALQNVVKHAAVTEAVVILARSGGFLSLTIKDKGVGMTPEPRENFVGLGLVSIKERTRLVNGTMELQSVPNEGTTLRIRVPEAVGALTNRAEA